MVYMERAEMEEIAILTAPKNIKNKVDVMIVTEKSEELNEEKQKQRKTTLETKNITTKFMHTESKKIAMKVDETEKIGAGGGDIGLSKAGSGRAIGITKSLNRQFSNMAAQNICVHPLS